MAADPVTVIKNAAKKNKGFSDPKSADKFRLKTQEIRGTRGTEKLKSKLRREDRSHQKKEFKQERGYEHQQRRITRTHLREESVRGTVERGAAQDARQRAYMQFRAQQQLELSQQRMQQRAAFKQSQKPTLGQRVFARSVAQPTEEATTTVAGGLFRMFAVIVGLSFLYLIVSQKGNPGAVTAVQGIGGFLYRLTGTTPLVSVKSKTPL